jgi:hypothetical protein
VPREISEVQDFWSVCDGCIMVRSDPIHQSFELAAAAARI